MSLAKMQYEEMPLSVSKKAAKEIAKDYDIRYMDSYSVLWFLTKKHKFGLLMTFTVVYVMFSLFGMVIVGLVESL